MTILTGWFPHAMRLGSAVGLTWCVIEFFKTQEFPTQDATLFFIFGITGIVALIERKLDELKKER